MSSVVSQVPGFGKGGPERSLPVPSAPGISLFDDITWTGVNGLVSIWGCQVTRQKNPLHHVRRVFNVVPTFSLKPACTILKCNKSA